MVEKKIILFSLIPCLAEDMILDINMGMKSLVLFCACLVPSHALAEASLADLIPDLIQIVTEGHPTEALFIEALEELGEGEIATDVDHTMNFFPSIQLADEFAFAVDLNSFRSGPMHLYIYCDNFNPAGMAIQKDALERSGFSSEHVLYTEGYAPLADETWRRQTCALSISAPAFVLDEFDQEVEAWATANIGPLVQTDLYPNVTWARLFSDNSIRSTGEIWATALSRTSLGGSIETGAFQIVRDIPPPPSG